MKTKPRSITHPSVTTTYLTGERLARLAQVLPADVRPLQISSAIALAYHLVPALATNAERRAWLARVETAGKALQSALALGPHDVEEANSEDLEALGPLPQVLDHALRAAAARRALLRVEKRGKGKRQVLADDLARIWPSKPTATIHQPPYGEPSRSPFVQTLAICIEAAEGRIPRDSSLKTLAENAIASRR